MSERSYTVEEIDTMRRAVEHRWLYGTSIYSGLGGGVSASRAYIESEKVRCVEEILRTYMLAGIEPEEVN